MLDSIQKVPYEFPGKGKDQPVQRVSDYLLNWASAGGRVKINGVECNVRELNSVLISNDLKNESGEPLITVIRRNPHTSKIENIVQEEEEFNVGHRETSGVTTIYPTIKIFYKKKYPQH